MTLLLLLIVVLLGGCLYEQYRVLHEQDEDFDTRVNLRADSRDSRTALDGRS